MRGQHAVTYSMEQYVGCARKISYRSRKSAQDAAHHMRRKPDAPPLRVYSCAYCGGFHLTKDWKAMR